MVRTFTTKTPSGAQRHTMPVSIRTLRQGADVCMLARPVSLCLQDTFQLSTSQIRLTRVLTATYAVASMRMNFHCFHVSLTVFSHVLCIGSLALLHFFNYSAFKLAQTALSRFPFLGLHPYHVHPCYFSKILQDIHEILRRQCT